MSQTYYAILKFTCVAVYLILAFSFFQKYQKRQRNAPKFLMIGSLLTSGGIIASAIQSVLIIMNVLENAVTVIPPIAFMISAMGSAYFLRFALDTYYEEKINEETQKKFFLGYNVFCIAMGVAYIILWSVTDTISPIFVLSFILVYVLVHTILIVKTRKVMKKLKSSGYDKEYENSKTKFQYMMIGSLVFIFSIAFLFLDALLRTSVNPTILGWLGWVVMTIGGIMFYQSYGK